MKRLEMIPSKLLKKGTASAIAHAIMVIRATRAIQIAVQMRFE